MTITTRTDSNSSYTSVTANVRRPNAPECGRIFAKREYSRRACVRREKNGAKRLNESNHIYVDRIYRLDKKEKKIYIYIMFSLNVYKYTLSLTVLIIKSNVNLTKFYLYHIRHVVLSKRDRM